jgi:histidine triad (HIT) family protein
MVTVGLEVPHAHLHLIPISQAEDLDFSNPKLKLDTAELIAIQELIIAKLS